MRTLPRLRVLVTQGSMKHSMGLIRHLSRQGHTACATIDPSDNGAPIARSRYCAGVYRVPHDDEAAFVSAMLRLLERERFDVLIPVGFPVTRFAARNLEALRRVVAIAAPDPGLEALAEDKLAVNESAMRLGVSAPRTVAVDESRNIREQVGSVMKLPVIIKGRGESPKGIVVRVDTWGDEQASVDVALNRVRNGAVKIPLVAQEYIPGWGCGFFATYDRGVCRRVFMHRRIREWPASGGASSCAQSFRSSILESEGRRLLDGLHWHGIAMAEFRHDTRDGSFRLIELNAKLWGSLELALAAGADFADDYLRLALGEPMTFHADYREITFQWLLGGDLQHAIARPSHALKVAATALRPDVATDVHPDDPGLLVARLRAALGRRLLTGRSRPRK